MTEKTPEEIALARIKKVSSRTNILNLFGIGLRILPPEIFQLSHLMSIDLRDNKLSNLPPEIGNLVNLETLYLSNNQLTDIPAELGRLTQLVKLDLAQNKLMRLPLDLIGLIKLRLLDLSGNELGIPPEIIRNVDTPSTLLSYYFAANLGTKEFQEQFVKQFQNLPPEETRNRLSYLLFSENLNNLSEGKTKKFLVKFNELLQSYKSPKSSSTELETLFAEFVKLAPSGKPINEVKLLVVGQGSVGKTSLVKRLILNSFDVSENKTDGISISKWNADNKSKNKNQPSQIKLNLWDFGGQEIMHATHQFFLTKRSLYLLVLDSRLTQEENRVEYWLKIIQSFGGESPVLIVGNKIDQHPLDIDRTGLQKKYPNIVGILETSAATGAGIEALKAALTEQVNNLPHVRDLLPETWFTVKTKLEELGRQSNFITHDRYLELCVENEVSDETSQRTLIGFLHDLGVVLHFQDDPRLEALGILNPQWVTNGVYKILNSHTLFQNKGVLTTSMLDEILNLPEYPRGKRLFIVDMMKKFELCYDIESDKTFLVPDLLPKDQPELNFNGIPAFEYAYPVLPSSVITRFIVRMNQKIDDGFVWRTGVVLKIGENKALVKADIEDRKITIAIDGVEHTRRDALSAIRFQLDEIHGSIKGLDAQKRVPIPNAPNAEPLEYEYLLMLEREGDETCRVKDGTRLITVNVRQVLSAIESESQRRQSATTINNNIYVAGNVNDSNLLAGNDNEADIIPSKSVKNKKK